MPSCSADPSSTTICSSSWESDRPATALSGYNRALHRMLLSFVLREFSMKTVVALVPQASEKSLNSTCPPGEKRKLGEWEVSRRITIYWVEDFHQNIAYSDRARSVSSNSLTLMGVRNMNYGLKGRINDWAASTCRVQIISGCPCTRHVAPQHSVMSSRNFWQFWL